MPSRRTPARLPRNQIGAPIRRVVFTCDLARLTLDGLHYQNAQSGNLRWLCAVLGVLRAWPSMGIEVKLVEPAPTLEVLRTQVLSPAVLREYEADSSAAWLRRYDDTGFDVRTGLVDELLDSDLVLGFELPPGVKRMLHARGHRYISFHVHALRFLRDLCLGAVTNCEPLCRHLERAALPRREIEVQANRFSALAARRRWPALEIPAGWPLLIGQTARDSVLIDHGRFVDWPDFDEQLTELLGAAPGCVVLEHPMRACSSEIALHVRGLLDIPVLMSNANGYGVVFGAAPGTRALTLASSLGVEAGAVGLETSFLLGDPRHRLMVPGVDIGTELPLHHGVLDPEFWRALLGRPDTPPDRPCQGLAFGFGDSYLRQGLESWSYKKMAEGMQAPRARKVLFPCSSHGELGHQRLRDQITGAPTLVQGWAGEQDHDDGGIEFIEASALLETGVELDVSASDPFAPVRLTGFHDREGWGAWSAGKDSSVSLGVGPRALDERCSLSIRLRLRIFHELLQHCPCCRVSRRGQTLALVFFRPASAADVEIEITTPADERWCTIELQLSDIGKPKQSPQTKDHRTLGLGLLGLTARVQQDVAGSNGSVRPSPPSLVWGVGPDKRLSGPEGKRP